MEVLRTFVVDCVQPKTIPATVGVAGVPPPPPPAVPQQIAFAPLDIRTWPAVPVAPAQSMMPAAGRIERVLQPVSQQHPLPNPMASWQSPVLTGKGTL